ncbi:MAG: YqhV family protein [Thermoanaerobacteraceae bacterium]|nr:YqhV family protein [Thermoanaerobacteraceae bacterium]
MDPIVTSMAIMRFISSIIELAAALLFLKSKSVEKALRINATLGLIGPLIFMGVSLLGLAGISGKITFAKLIIILAGVMLVLIGTTAE